MTELLHLLIVNAAASAACFFVLWLIGLRLRDVSFIDSWWALGMVVLAWASFFLSGPPSGRKVVLLAICTCWGVRLGVYLVLRWRRQGPDPRYQSMARRAEAERGIGFARWSAGTVFSLQAVLQFIVALPVQLGLFGSRPLGAVAAIGILLATLGIVFESVGDAQLAAFKSKPENKGKVLDTGLWRYTRHPNYFGDACVWWGLWLIAAEGGLLGMATIIGPILLTALLTRWSGVPTTEGPMRRRKPDYEDYIRRTPAFVPWFPR
jgi:steroid 5-alpha reductase family enzyme